MELKLVSPPGRQIVQGYRDDGFTISGRRFSGGVLVMVDRSLPLPVGSVGEFTVDALLPLLELDLAPDLVLVGTGAMRVQLEAAFEQAARTRGLKLEAMATPAACRTYNVLMAEDRNVAAALLPLVTPEPATR
jgi:uncharacterized protein